MNKVASKKMELQEQKADTNPVPSKNGLRFEWLSPASLTAAISGLLSIVALLVSVRGCNISEKAFDLAAEDFYGSRSAVYKGTVKETDEIELSAVDPNIQIQLGKVFYPQQVDKTEWPVSPPKFSFPIVVLRGNMEKIIDQRIAREDDYIKIVDKASIPLIIQSTYIAKGKAFKDTSLYQLLYLAVVPPERYKSPSITFNGLSFLGHLDPDTEPQSYLEALWKSGTLATDPLPRKAPNRAIKVPVDSWRER
jgi:hypothetical protein